MTIYYVKDPSNGKLKQKENILVWFDGSKIKDCENALVLYGESLLLLKTIEEIRQPELSELVKDDTKWKTRFGKEFKAEQLRQAIQESYTVNRHE